MDGLDDGLFFFVVKDVNRVSAAAGGDADDDVALGAFEALIEIGEDGAGRWADAGAGAGAGVCADKTALKRAIRIRIPLT